ncbi:hypothetical protein E2C01_101012 [Portunus trituberculatus]|uniref:Uncharacterized protein n=1 Tax=Portunus trituberculatus TaxID=210409 RepID=A0A5B7KJE1_PORTR|nr:hypothetical protein [Portunus trituberculatus]
MPRQLAGCNCLVRKSQHTSTTSVSSRWCAVDNTTSTVSSWSSRVPVGMESGDDTSKGYRGDDPLREVVR